MNMVRNSHTCAIADVHTIVAMIGITDVEAL
jgi:hypothetical protein